VVASNQGRAEAALTRPLSRDRPFGKCSVCSGNGRVGFQGRLKELNWARGLGGRCQRKACKGPTAERPRAAGLRPKGGGGESHIRQEALLTPVRLECGVNVLWHPCLNEAEDGGGVEKRRGLWRQKEGREKVGVQA
jgi:hypothetical protein